MFNVYTNQKFPSFGKYFSPLRCSCLSQNLFWLLEFSVGSLFSLYFIWQNLKSVGKLKEELNELCVYPSLRFTDY